MKVWAELVFSEASLFGFVDGCLLPGSSHGLLSVCVCVLISSSSKDNICIGSRPSHKTSF